MDYMLTWEATPLAELGFRVWGHRSKTTLPNDQIHKVQCGQAWGKGTLHLLEQKDFCKCESLSNIIESPFYEVQE